MTPTPPEIPLEAPRPRRGKWLLLPFHKPPLHANQRLHYRERAGLTKTVRTAAWALGRGSGIPKDLPHLHLWLVYQPPDNTRRDEDNLVPTLKALADGLVDAQLTADDTPQYMTKHMPRIVRPANPPRMWLRLEW